jgi:hypothetical protein
MTKPEEKRSTHRRNSGVALYFSNSSSHSVSESGGRTPVMGRHSVMLSPDSVRRVTPPTTMTAMTRVEESKSQFPTAGGESTGRCCASGCCPWALPFEEKKRGWCCCLSTDLHLPVGWISPDGKDRKKEDEGSLVVQIGAVCFKRSS